jgi:WD40 repeat protein
LRDATNAPASAPITALHFAPDGKTLLTASQAGLTLYPWPLPAAAPHPANGAAHPPAESKRVTLPSALPNLHALAFSPDGNTLALAGGAPVESGKVELRAWPGGKLLRTLAGPTDEVTSVAFSPDGKLLAAGSADNTIRLFDPTTGRQARLLRGHAGPVLAVAFSPDGQWLASGSGDRSLKLWDVAPGRLLRTLTNHLGAVEAVAFRPQGRYLASASADATVRIWQPEIGRLVRIIRGHDAPIRDVCYTPDGEHLLSAADDGRVRLLAGDSDAILRTFDGPHTWLYCVTTSPDSKLVLAGDARGQLWAWRIEDGKRLWPPATEAMPGRRASSGAGEIGARTEDLGRPSTDVDNHQG